ncbi:putative glycosyltransferase EpsF [Crateriforma conspicua]|uniref:Putative glycosyltransferase EpsF n=1 Tax=Crateriforma conspicua TaxID=2527996 RepID=A0A5C6FNM7_9PLAN|nr:glycosyltransferase [Crateriforma conspicua]TWU63009.1 putative glycosyltransferase EpsF [Crateriforma conspicua]
MAVTPDPNAPIRVLLMIGSMDGGGSERQILHLLRHLDRDRFEPHLYLKRAEGIFLKAVPPDVPVHVASDFATDIQRNWPGRIHRQESRELATLLRDEQIDVVYDRTYHMTLTASSACRRCRVPRVSTIVSPPSHALPMVETKFIAWKRRLLAMAYRRSFQVIAVSRQSAESAAQFYGLSPNRIRVIPNPIDLDALRNDAADAETRIGQQHQRLRLVCVARMTPEKGHEVLLDSLRKLQSGPEANRIAIQLDLVGDGPLRPKLQKIVASNGWNHPTATSEPGRPTNHWVRFLGRSERPAAHMVTADALVLPSLFEGMPNVVLEALALKVPVICTTAGGAPEIQRDKPIAFWAGQGNADQLAAAIAAMSRSPERVSRHVENGFDVIGQHHNVQRTTERIEDILSAAAGRGIDR